MMRRLLPSFSAANVTPANMRIDKFCIEFKRHRFQSYLPTGNWHEDGFSTYLQFFTEASELFGISSPQYGQAVRYKEGFLVTGDNTYFNGVRRSPLPQNHTLIRNNAFRKCTLLLNGNFNRFYRAQQERAITLAFESNGGMPAWHTRFQDCHVRVNTGNYHPIDLLRVTAPEQTHQHFPYNEIVGLDRRDNIMGEALWRRTSNVRSLFSFFLALCMDEIERQSLLGLHETDYAFMGEINRRRTVDGYIEDRDFLAQRNVLPLFDWSQGNISELQVFIEFAVHDALEFMRIRSPGLCETARDYGREGHITPRRGRIVESPSISLWLTNEIELVVYAKHDKRVRFEVRYTRACPQLTII